MSPMLVPPDLALYRHELAALIQRYTGTDGTHDTAIPELRLRRSSVHIEPTHSILIPSLCIIAQGAKVAMLAEESYYYDDSSYLVTPVHLPVTGKVIEATAEVPYLSLQLTLHPDRILEIIHETDWQWDGHTGRGILVGQTPLSLLEAAVRLVRLLDTPEDIPVLAPLIIREIIYRVLKDEQGALIAQFSFPGSHASRVLQVIQRIHHDYAQPMQIEQLAHEVNLSPSALHKHFKKVTAMSPLQYQKVIRLQAARRLLLIENKEAADAGFQVGYESPSQFSREYARMFGRPPISDRRHLWEVAARTVGTDNQSFFAASPMNIYTE